MASLQPSPRSRLRVPSRINDNQCVEFVTRLKDSVYVSGQIGLNPCPVIAGDKKVTVHSHVDFCVANAHSVTGLPQKKGVNPNYCYNQTEIKYVKDVSCVGHLTSANLVTNVLTVAIDPPVHNFWEKWEALGSSPNVVTTVREGYTLPFRFRPSLTRSPTVISNYHYPSKQAHLLEALYQLVNKNAVEPVANQNSLGFYNRLFLVPKPNNRWRPIFDLSTLNTFLNTELFKMETPETIRTSLQPGQWVTSIDFKDAYFHIPIQSVQEVHVFSPPGSVLPVQSPTLRPFHSTHGVHSGGQRVQTDGLTEGYKNPPVPRRLVGESHIPPNLSPAYTYLGSSLSRVGLAGEQGEVRTGTKTGFQLCRLPVRPQGGQGQTHTRALAVPGPAVHVPHKAPNSNRKASPPRSTSYETHTVALEEQLEGTRITRKCDAHSQIASPPLKVVAGGKQWALRSTITHTKTCSADIYRCIKRRVGRSLKRAHCKRNLVPPRKQIADKPFGTKSGLSGPKRVPRPLLQQHSAGSQRQHNSGCLYQQGRGDEVGLTVPHCGESCPGSPGNR